MAYIEPSSEIYLTRKYKGDPGYTNVALFDTKEAQQNYFKDGSIVLSEQSYVRHTHNSIKLSLNTNFVPQAITQCNYMMFKNPAYENRWWYAFITDWEFLNNYTCYVYYQIDIFQTYWFDVRLGTCHVERITVNDDYPGHNIVDEGLPTGDSMVYQKLDITGFPFNTGLYYMLTLVAMDEAMGKITSNIYSGVDIEINKTIDNTTNYIKAITDAGKSDSIVGVLQVPSDLIDRFYPTPSSDSSFTSAELCTDFTVDADPYKMTQGKPNATLNGYKPKNNKLLMYPFNAYMAISSDGDSNVYKIEDFIGTYGIRFSAYTSLSATPTFAVVPKSYKGIEKNYNEEVICSDFPQCPVAIDGYKAWLAQNKNSIANARFQASEDYNLNRSNSLRMLGLNLTDDVLGATTGIMGNATQGNTQGMLESAVGSVASMARHGIQQQIQESQNVRNYQRVTQALAAQISDARMLPDKVKGGSASYTDTTRNTTGITFYHATIKAAQAKILDDYFTMYGYLVNDIRVPNLTARPQFTYIKCNVVNFEWANILPIPNKALQQLKKIFTDGVTLWRKPEKIGDYSVDNSL